MQQFSVAARTYIWLVCLLGVASFAFACYFSWPAHDKWPLLLVGSALAAAAGFRKVLLFAVRRRDKESPLRATMSLGFIPAYLILLAVNPFGGMAVAGINALVSSFYPRRAHTYQIAFSVSAVSLSAFASGLILQAFGFYGYQNKLDVITIFKPEMQAVLPRILSGIALSTVTYWLVNTILIAAVIALTSNQNPLKIWRSSFLWMGPGYFAGASCAVAVNALRPLATDHPLAIFAVIVVGVWLPIVIFLVYKAHNDRAEDQEKHIEALSKSHGELEDANRELASANAELQHSKEDLQQLYTSTVESLALAIDAKDRYTKEHIQRVKGIAVSIAKELGMTGNELKALETAALLHDIGKIAVPEHILTKPGRLTDEEFESIKSHPDMGAKILQPVPFPFPVMPAVRSHHERWDGGGYPDGLKGEDIPLGGRILAVADVYDALTTDRSYRPGWPHEKAVEHLKENAGSHFDPAVVQAFFAVLERSPRLHIGSNIESDDTEKAHIGSGFASGFSSSAAADIHDAVTGGLNRASFEYVSLYEISQAASASLPVGEMLSVLAAKFKNIFNASTCVLLLLDNEVLTVQRAVGTNAPLFDGVQIPLGEGPTGEAAQNGVGMMDESRAREMQAAFTARWRRENASLPLVQIAGEWSALPCGMIAPLMSDGKIIGTVNLYQERAGAFDREDLRVLQAVAVQAARAISHAREYDRTRISALTDSLTGLYNARHLAHFMDKELERARLEDRPLTVLVLDLDNFKPVNDRFGHTRGNEVLRDLGGVFQSVLRSGDLVARYAGDEFVIVLPSTGPTEARIVMDKIRDAVRVYDPRQSGADLEDVRVGVSVGAASFPYDGSEAAILISCADRAMYRDKNERKALLAGRELEIADGSENGSVSHSGSGGGKSRRIAVGPAASAPVESDADREGRLQLLS